VALNARLHLDDFRYSLADAGARVLLHSSEFKEEAALLRDELGLVSISLDGGNEIDSLDYSSLLEGVPDTPIIRPGDDEAPAWITYTAGTTGLPKGVVLSHRALWQVALNILIEFGPIRQGEQIVLTQPLSHGAGYFVLPYLVSGGGVWVMKRFDPEEVARISARPAAYTLKIVPAMIGDLLGLNQDLGYETIIYGASPIPRPRLEAALDRFGPKMVQVYGQSEAPVTLTCLQKADHAGAGEQRFSAGRAWRSVAVEVRDPEGNGLRPGEQGEVTVRGPHMMTGYHRLPEATEKVMRNGWIWTNDMGYLDERGYLYLLGRKDEIINSGGFNIAPREVEGVITKHPDVEECYALGLPDSQWGSAVAALIRLRPGSVVTIPELIDFARPRLGFRTPRHLKVVASIPKTAYGKVDRSAALLALRPAPVPEAGGE
jgi:fatty-acyl-CoA synthase